MTHATQRRSRLSKLRTEAVRYSQTNGDGTREIDTLSSVYDDTA
jgi:hypothetical protein